MIRRPAATALLLSAVFLFAASSSSEGAAGATLAQEAFAVPFAGDAALASANIATAPSKRQALAFAHAVNLTAADLPGFKASSSHEHETSAEKQPEGELSRCAGAPNPRDQLAQASSAEFGRESNGAVLSVQSGVSIERTSTLAAQELAAVRSARGRRCIAHFVNRLFKRQESGGARVSPVSVSPGSLSAPGTTGSFAWRIRSTITSHGVRIPFSMDFVGFAYGPAEVTLFTSGMPDPLPAALEQKLFARLVQRAKTHAI